MKKGRLVNFKLTDDYLNEIDNWRSSTGMSRSEALRIAIKTLKGQKFVQMGLDEYEFKGFTRSKSTKG